MGSDPTVIAAREFPAARAGRRERAQNVDLSVVVPLYNERDSLRQLVREIDDSLTELGRQYEVICVDDGSTDGSDRVLAELAALHPRLRSVRFHHNKGKATAYNAAFAEARGGVVVTLDADLQDDPAEIPRLIETLERDADLVVGWKRGRIGNEPHKAVPSWCFNRIKARIFGLRLRDSNSGFRAMKAAVAREIDLYAGNYRFLPEMAHRRGFRVVEVPVNHRRRIHGRSKYGPGRFFGGVLDLLTLTLVAGFHNRPLHFFGGIGVLPLLAGASLQVYALVMKLLGDSFQSHVAAIMIGVLLILFGFQLVSVGLIGEFILARSRGSSGSKPHYTPIRSRAGDTAREAHEPTEGARRSPGSDGTEAAPPIVEQKP